ncbi:MAG TPA: hypothetical protein VGO47_07295 [Chlamydiales bacterium]|nr:hypothetical protein [Chlamydiales bacterium]
MKKTILLLFFMVSCGSPSVKDLRAEGEGETRKLAGLLRDIETREQLQKKIGKIQQCYAKIADLMIQLREMSEGLAGDEEASEFSDALFIELVRLYEMPGCRRLLEAAQEGAIEKLYPRSLKK